MLAGNDAPTCGDTPVHEDAPSHGNVPLCAAGFLGGGAATHEDAPQHAPGSQVGMLPDLRMLPCMLLHGGCSQMGILPGETAPTFALRQGCCHMYPCIEMLLRMGMLPHVHPGRGAATCTPEWGWSHLYLRVGMFPPVGLLPCRLGVSGKLGRGEGGGGEVGLPATSDTRGHCLSSVAASFWDSEQNSAEFRHLALINN